MASYSRFTDENYKNWLKTTMSLQLLRSSLYPFIENETETYHRSLLQRFTDAFGNETCAKKCNTKKRPNKELPICKTCKWWRDQILENHNNKNGLIYWENSKPYLWSSDKWEVAKVYMPRGNQNHHEIDQFDISAILNFMTFCRHFKKFAQGNILTEVTKVRNQMMHSPDMKVPKEDMEKHLGKILAFVKHLQAQAPELKLEVLLEEIDQLQNTELNIVLEGLEPKGDVIKNLLSVQKVQDLEQQVLKEKIECLNHRLEEDRNNLQTEEGFVQIQEVKAMKDFLEQNMDLLVQLGPQVEKLNSIEEKVDQHDQQLMDLTVKVDHLEKNKYEPVFSADSVKFKNHLLEEAMKNNWPVPVFSEIRHSNGYTGQVVVNGQTFKGLQIHPRIKAAHQEVSNIALEQLLSSNMMKSSISAPPNDQSGTSTATVSGPRCFCSVTVTLNKEIMMQEGHSGKEEAIQFAYQKLSAMFGLPVVGVSHKQAVQQYFARNGFQQPEEILNTGSDEKVYCKLKLSGPFTFQGKEGAGKKRLAEQQAAKEALLRLGRVIDYTGETGDNYKGTLKERLEALGLEQPIYKDIQTTERKGIEEETSMSEDPSVMVSPCQLTQNADAEVSKSQQGTATGQMTDPNASILKQETSVSPASPPFYAIVNVPVKIGFDGPEAPTKDHAVQAAYVALREALALGDPASAPPAGSARQLVLDFFRQAKCQENYETTTEEKIKCRLDISGVLIFQNQEGVSKKQLAVQGAAKEALSRLARVMRWDLSGVNENYRGKLQELLAKQGQTPSYLPVSKPGEAETSSTHAVSDHSSARAPIIQEISISNADDLTTQPDESSQLPPPRKVPKIEAPEIKNLLRLSGLQPPFVNLESFSMEMKFECRVEIHLANYTFQNEVGYRNKKEAIRSTYAVFGQALGICDQNAEEILSVAAVKQYFSKRSFELPSEEVKEKEDKNFFCSIHVASCDFSYEGEGQSEEIARREASKRAFSQLSALFGYKVAASISSNEGLDDRLALMLKGAHQEKPVFKLTSTLYRGTIKLLFSNFTLAIKGKNNKKLTRNKLSERILGLLGENDTETSNSISTRNRVDEWFIQKRFQLPIFEDTEEQYGAKVTFSATLICCNPDWQVCCEDVDRRLTEELKARFRYLIEEDTD